MAELSEAQITQIAEAAVRAALSQTTRLAREDASDLVAAAATKAVNEAHIRLFADLGYDLANREDQKRLRENLAFGDRLHRGTMTIGAAVANAIAIALALGLIGLIALGAKMTFMGGHPPQPPMVK